MLTEIFSQIIKWKKKRTNNLKQTNKQIRSAVLPTSAVYCRIELTDTAHHRTVPVPTIVPLEGLRYGNGSRHAGAVARIYGYGAQP
jgi:hypothetical protein